MLTIDARCFARSIALVAVFSVTGCGGGGGGATETADFVSGTMNEYVTSLAQATADCGSLQTWVDDAIDEAVPEDGQLADAWESLIEAADHYASICEKADAAERAEALGDIGKALSGLQARIAEL